MITLEGWMKLDTKNPIWSKTLWLNVAGLVILILKMIADPSISALIPSSHIGLMVILGANIIVRFYTTCAVAFSMPVFNPPAPSQQEMDAAMKLHEEQVKLRDEAMKLREEQALKDSTHAAHAALDLIAEGKFDQASDIPQPPAPTIPAATVAVAIPIDDKPAKIIPHYPPIKG